MGWHGATNKSCSVCRPCGSVGLGANQSPRAFLGAFRGRRAWAVADILICILRIGRHVSVLGQSRQGATTTGAGGCSGSENGGRTRGYRVPFGLLLYEIGGFVKPTGITVRIGLVAAKLGFA